MSGSFAAISFFNGVMEVAEVEGHHPDLHLTNYRDVQVSQSCQMPSPLCCQVSHMRDHDEDVVRELQVVVSTHAIKGLSIYDFILAAKIDSLPVVYSPKWLSAQKQESRGAAEPSCAPLSDAPSLLI